MLQPSAASGESSKGAHQLINSNGTFCGVAGLDRTGDAGVDVVSEHDLSGTRQRTPHCRDLCECGDAGGVFRNHPAHGGQLTLRTLEARQETFLVWV
jgi:hypothetical protein